MKILILGLFLITSFALQGQQYVSSDEAVTIVDDNEVLDMNTLQNLSPTDAVYEEKKYNIIAYRTIRALLDKGTHDVEGAIKHAVFGVADRRQVAVTDQEYDDGIPNEKLQQLKDRLETLLTQ